MLDSDSRASWGDAGKAQLGPGPELHAERYSAALVGTCWAVVTRQRYHGVVLLP